jgi:hypothetical protein
MTRRPLATIVLWLHGAVAYAQETSLPTPYECAPPAQPGTPAELAKRAEEHYNEASRLYTLAEYERAVEEFTASFCLLATPEAAKNVGQSYLQLADYEKTIDWWEYFVHILPPSQAQQRALYSAKIDRLRKLKAKVHVATDPPRATIVIAQGSEVVGKGVANDDKPIQVLAGTYVMRIESPSHEPIEQEITVKIGQPYTFAYRLDPESGTLLINTEPRTARIFLDRRLVGSGSFTDKKVTTGPHTVQVEAEGRVTEQRMVLVTGKAPAVLNVKLSVPPRNGRTELLAGATSWGLIGGGTIGLLVQTDTAFIFTFAGGTASFILGYVSIPRRVSVGTSSTVVGASLWGGLEGLGTSLLLTSDENLVAPITMASSALFGAGGAFVADRLRLSAGDAALVNSGALWGTVTGILTWQSFTEETDPIEGLGPPLVLAGVNVGLLAGITLAQRYEITRTHAALIDLSGTTGTLVGLGVALLLPDEQQQGRNVHFMLGGMAAGLVLGTILTRNYDETGELTPITAGVRPLIGRSEAGSPTVGVAGEF